MHAAASIRMARARCNPHYSMFHVWVDAGGVRRSAIRLALRTGYWTFLHLMTLALALPTTSLAIFLSSAALAFSQAAAPTESEPVRVNVTINADGSRTIYEFDSPHRKATATTRERDGKVRGKIQYELDDAGRFSSGRVFGPDGNFRFRTLYKYDSAGRLETETKIGKDDAVLSKIVYSYDQSGKQTGYSIFDDKGKLIGQTPSATPSPAKKRP